MMELKLYLRDARPMYELSVMVMSKYEVNVIRSLKITNNTLLSAPLITGPMELRQTLFSS